METSLEIKNKLVNWIMSADDLTFLQALQTIIDLTEKNLYQLTNEQKESIEISRKQIGAGNYKDNETVLSATFQKF